MQLLALLTLYLLLGLGCTAVARMRRSRPLIELLALLALWPLYAPFVLSDADATASAEPKVVASAEVASLEARCKQINQRLAEIDALHATDEWNPSTVQQQLGELTNESRHGELRNSLTLRMQHIERLHFLRNLHADELDATGALLHQRKAQVQLSRFIDSDDHEAGLRLQALRERVLSAEHALVSETELLSLCRES